jgi:hypothetical protein
VINFGQRLGTFTFFLIGAGVRDDGRDLVRNQLKEILVALIELNARAKAGDHDSGEMMLNVGTDGEHSRVCRRVIPRAERNTIESDFDVVDELNVFRGQHTGQWPHFSGL